MTHFWSACHQSWDWGPQTRSDMTKQSVAFTVFSEENISNIVNISYKKLWFYFIFVLTGINHARAYTVLNYTTRCSLNRLVAHNSFSSLTCRGTCYVTIRRGQRGTTHPELSRSSVWTSSSSLRMLRYLPPPPSLPRLISGTIPLLLLQRGSVFLKCIVCCPVRVWIQPHKHYGLCHRFIFIFFKNLFFLTKRLPQTLWFYHSN